MKELELDIEDYKRLLEHEGTIFGCVKKVSLKSFEEEILEEYKKYFQTGKSIVIELYINKKTSLFEINHYMSKIDKACPPNIPLVFGCSENTQYITSQVIIKILISGL